MLISIRYADLISWEPYASRWSWYYTLFSKFINWLRDRKEGRSNIRCEDGLFLQWHIIIIACLSFVCIICLYQILVQCLITYHNIRFNKVSMLQKNLWAVFNCNTINLKQKYHPKILTFQRFEALFTKSLSLHLILRLRTSEAISPLAMTIRNYCWNIHSAIPLHLSPEDNLIMYRHSYNLCC